MVIYILFVVGFFALIKGADMMVDGASSIAKRMNVSDLVIGLTIVAFGTSTPELFVNIIASVQGNTDIAVGNILGSNIANILLILGITAVIYPIKIHKTTVWKEIPFSLLAALVLGVLANDEVIDERGFSELSRIDGLVLVGFFTIFMYYIFDISKRSPIDEDREIKHMSTFKAILFIIIGLAGLAIGGHWIVNGAVDIANRIGISQSVIGLTIVAIGTSLPELATSVVAALKKNTDIAVGNAVGSNIFNIFWVLAVSSIINPLPFQRASNVDILMTTIASIMLFVFLFTGKRHVLDRWEGILFLLSYLFYIGILVIRG